MSVAPVETKKKSRSPTRKTSKRSSFLRSITPNKRREKLGCEYFDETSQLEDGELPSLKKTNSSRSRFDGDLDDDDLKSVISRASNLSTTARKRHSAFWNQLNISKSNDEDEAPDDEASSYHPSVAPEERQTRNNHPYSHNNDSHPTRDTKKKREVKEHIEYLDNNDEDDGPIMAMLHRICGDCVGDDKSKKVTKRKLSKKESSHSMTNVASKSDSMRDLELMALSHDDESIYGVYENTAIEIEYVQPTPQNNNNNNNNNSDSQMKKNVQEAFLQLGDSGDVSVMVKKNKKKKKATTPDIIDSDVHVPTKEEEEEKEEIVNESIPRTIPNVLSDLSEDDDTRYQLSSTEKDDLLNHLANEAKEEFDKQKLNQSLQSEEDDDISEILNNWHEQETSLDNKNNDVSAVVDVVVETKEEPKKEEKVEKKKKKSSSKSPPRKVRSLQQPLSIQTDFSDETITKHHVGEIDKKVVQTKISSGMTTQRISQLQAPSSPSRSPSNSGGSRIHLPKIKIPHLQQAKGFSPVLDYDDDYEEEEEKKEIATTKPNKANPSQSIDQKMERSLPSSKRDNSKKITKREQFPSPQGVNQFPSQTPSHQMRRTMSYGGSEKSMRSRPASPTKSDPYSTPKFKVFPKLKGSKNKDSNSSEKESLMGQHHNSKGKSLWGSRKKRDKKSKKEWHAMEDDSDEEILGEQTMTSTNQRHFLYNAEETSKSTQKLDSDRNKSRGTDSLRDDEKPTGSNDDSDDTSFTDDKTVATANIQNIKLKSPRNTPQDPTDEFINKPTSPNDDEKSTYSSGTGLSLSSTWSSASTATSTRRRHHGAGKSRKTLSETNKTTGWYESIQAAAKENKRVWDVKLGWVDYVEPERETNFNQSQNHNIGSLSIKSLSPKKRQQEEVGDSQDDVPKQPINVSPPSPKKEMNEVSPPSSPPGRSLSNQNNVSQDDESLAQPSVGSTVSDISDQPRSPAQFLPAKELSVANDARFHSEVETSPHEKNEQYQQVSASVSPIRKTTSRSIEQTDIHDTENVDANTELNIAVTYSEDSDDETDTNGGSVEVNSSGSDSDKQGDNQYQMLEETDYNDDDNDFDIPVEREKRNSDPSIKSDDETSSLLDDSDTERNMLYNWLETGENETDPFGVIHEQDDIPEAVLEEENSKLENDFIQKRSKPPTHPFTKPEMTQISDEDEKSAFAETEFDQDAFETNKGSLTEGLSRSTSNESDSSQRSAYDKNGFKIITDPKLANWGKAPSNTSLGDAGLGVVATFSESSGESEVKSHDNEVESLDEETSKISVDDQKSVKSANSVSSRARAWMEMMEIKKARLDSSQEISETRSGDSESRSRKLDVLVETPVNTDLVNSSKPQNESRVTVDSSKTAPASPRTKQEATETETNETRTLHSQSVKSKEEVAKETMMTFVSAADDDSVFKFERSKQTADDDTIFSNLDEKKNTEVKKAQRLNVPEVQKTFTRDDGYGQSGNLYTQNTIKKDLLSVNSDSFDETTLHSRSTIDKYGTGFEINSSFHRDDYSMASGKRSTFLSRMANFASVCEPMVPNALNCNPRKSEQGGPQEVPLAHLAFLQQRSVPNAEPLSRETKSFDSRYLNEEEYPGLNNDNNNVSPGRVVENEQPQSKPPLPTERMSDSGLSSSYLAAMAKFNKGGGNKNYQARSNASSANSSRNENWKGFLDRRSQSGVSSSSRRSNSGRSAEQHAAKKVEKLMRSLSQSENSGKEEVKTMLDSMSPKSKSRFRSPSTIESSSHRASNKKMAAAEARVEAMMAAMSKSDLEEAEI